MAKLSSGFALLLPAAACLLAAAAPLSALEARLERVTHQPFAAGESGNQHSNVVGATPDGRFLLIVTRATNLAAGVVDTNGEPDLLVYDRETQSFDWITVSLFDPQRPALTRLAGGPLPVLSDDGRFVAFQSSGRLHTPATTGEVNQVYLFDRQARTTTMVSHPPGNPLAHADQGVGHFLFISADGRYLAYESASTNLVAGDSNNSQDVFLYDRTTGASTLVSHTGSSPSTPANAWSTLRALSADGRFVLFDSRATNLVTGFADNNGAQNEDLYLWDRDGNSTALVSRGTGSPTEGANARSIWGLISADGSRIAFASAATNLLAGFTDNNGAEWDFYFRERVSGALQLVSGVSATATQNLGSWPLALSADGRYFFFRSKATDVIPGLVRPADDGYGHFRFDTGTRAIALVNHRAGQPAAIALGDPYPFRISPDGEAAAFTSGGSELVAGQTASGRQAFAYDMATATARLVSHPPGQPLAGEPGEPVAISADHRYVALSSESASLAAGDLNGVVDAFLYDLEGAAAAGRVSSAAVSGLMSTAGSFDFAESLPAAGLFLFHASDLSPFLPAVADPAGGRDPVLYDPRTGATSALVAPGGATPGGESRAAFAADGLNFLLRSTATGLVPGMTDGNGAGADLYAGNRTTGTLQLISSSGASASTSANQGVADNLVFSANGRFVAYDTLATDAVAGVTDTNGVEDIVLHDRQLGTRVLVTRSAAAPTQTANARSFPVGMSADGELLIFASRATNLTAGFVDLNSSGYDFFLYRRSTGVTSLVTRSAFSPVHGGNGGSDYGRLSADGRFFVFGSLAGNLIDGMTNNGANLDAFLYDTASGAISLVSHRPGVPGIGVNDHVFPERISADGRFVLLSSPDKLLIFGGTFPAFSSNTFLYDRLYDRNTLISHLPGQPSAAPASNSRGLAVSDDGRFVVFSSDAPNLVPGQTAQSSLAAAQNLFLVDRATSERVLLSRSLDGPQDTGNGYLGSVALGPAGRQVLFASWSSNLAPHQAWSTGAVFLADLTAGGSGLFSDGFELGDTSQWAQTVGAN